jgi:hypothetical protein
MNRDIPQERMRIPRTLVEAFGPEAKLHIPQKKTPWTAYLWMAAYGVAIGFTWYLIAAVKAGA